MIGDGDGSVDWEECWMEKRKNMTQRSKIKTKRNDECRRERNIGMKGRKMEGIAHNENTN